MMSTIEGFHCSITQAVVHLLLFHLAPRSVMSACMMQSSVIVLVPDVLGTGSETILCSGLLCM